MKILFAYRQNLPNDNLFVKTLVAGLQQSGIDVDCSLDIFWTENSERDYDIIHIQWPEELFKWKDISVDDLNKLQSKLNAIKSHGTKIVYTRHNLSAHYEGKILQQLYALIEQFADGVAHLGQFSQDDFLIKYPNLKSVQRIIPHHIYQNAYNENISQRDAREKLGIPINKFVILTFGKFRHRDEITMVINAFCKAKIKNKYLLAPRILPFEKRPQNYKFSNRVLSFLGYHIIYPLSNLFNMKLGMEKELVNDNELSYYFSAADVALVQRKSILNSGNIPTAFLFKKVVVAPVCGNLAEIMVATDNPTFNPMDKKSIAKALNQSQFLSQQKHGLENYEYAIQNWNIAKISSAYAGLYFTLKNNFSSENQKMEKEA